VNVQTTATVPATDQALQERRSLSPCASRWVWLRPGVGIESRRIGFEGDPVDATGMMVPEENGPWLPGQMPRRLSDHTLFIEVAFLPGLSVGISASIHRMGEDLRECRIRGATQRIGPGRPAGRVGSGKDKPSERNHSHTRRAEPNSAKRSKTVRIAPVTASSG
jgi:hypothetical protein